MNIRKLASDKKLKEGHSEHQSVHGQAVLSKNYNFILQYFLSHHFSDSLANKAGPAKADPAYQTGHAWF